MNLKPYISIVIPTFNRRELLQRALDSVFKQTYKNFEVIVVDDGSSDKTYELDIFRKPPANVHFIRLAQNSGVSKARNTGVANSKGEWLAFLDSDDMWLPAKLASQVEWLNVNPEYRIVQTKEVWIRNGKRVNPPKTHEKVGGDIFAISLDRCMVTPSSVIMQRSLFDEAGGFNEELPACEDYDLWLRITCRYQVGLINENLLIRYGGHEDQLTSTVKVLDSYRIKSMIHLIASGILSPDQERLTREALVKRAKIVANGCRKRGNENQYEYFKSITDRYR